MKRIFDMAIIGAGILGTTISYWLSTLYDLKICVIDKEKAVAMHTSSRNTGVVHSPFYLDPKKRKMSAISSLISHDLWEVLAKKNNLPWMPVGTIEVAIEEKQHRTLEKYLKWGAENGIPDEQLELLDSNELLKREPNLNCYSGLYCSRDVSTDYGIFTQELQKQSEKNGTEFLLDHKVESVKENSEVTLTFSDNSSLLAKFVVNCSGGNSLEIAKKFGLAEQYDDLHFRGEYWIAEKQFADLVNRNIYSVARFSEFPFLDPHWIKRADGKTEIGPNAVPVASPETYEGYSDGLTHAVSKIREIFRGNVRRLITNPDFFRLISREFLSSVSKSAMVHRVQQFIPSIKPEYFTERGTAGIRTPIITPEGTFLSDILELTGKNSFHILNYNSPGATGAPAYSAFVVKKLQDNGFLDYTQSQKDSIWSFDDVINQS
ncbi:MAG: NAD(P)/FAD-dependent oxidoreductase [Nitrososphaerales archaeon]